ncbi:hypothetical protein GCK72_004532 [Caenorhabditis remanei]|uniref:Uncharacterized protein n=1 Tax=Caenorhabditis remanei TaxID=31234 RepID=A0A6A5HDX2_CAERE|nr:hypothetical protein GCK72_004532 [Caenorhabditis remanei]KAF1764583.1 hypothetical protein GCK72_004532 [Caenorhabditis remanei]
MNEIVQKVMIKTTMLILQNGTQTNFWRHESPSETTDIVSILNISSDNILICSMETRVRLLLRLMPRRHSGSSHMSNQRD